MARGFYFTLNAISQNPHGRKLDGTDAELVWWRGWAPHTAVGHSTGDLPDQAGGSNSGLHILKVLVGVWGTEEHAEPGQALSAHCTVPWLTHKEIKTISSSSYLCNLYQAVETNSSVTNDSRGGQTHQQNKPYERLSHLLWVNPWHQTRVHPHR